MDDSFRFFPKTKHTLTIDPALTFLGTYSEELKI